LLEITTSLSTKIIKKGDYFSIYVSITNGHEKEITITTVKLFQPIGFTDAPINKQYTLFEGIKEFFSYKDVSVSVGVLSSKFELRSHHQDKHKQSYPSQTVIDELPGTPYIEVSSAKPNIEKKPNQIIQPKNTYREDFNLRAGWSGGLRPRPDTYIISGEVEYKLEDKMYYKQINIEVSIFPSLGSMLIGTLIGSLLGTVVNAIMPHIREASNPIPGLDLIIPQVFANLILGFIVGITLMRKKDVQPFLTVEDFWGGILLGFLVGFSGAQFIKSFLPLGR
jgi:hypothetical protein